MQALEKEKERTHRSAIQTQDLNTSQTLLATTEPSTGPSAEEWKSAYSSTD